MSVTWDGSCWPAKGTWAIDGHPTAELEHKLSESPWWIFVLADPLRIDMTDAYNKTMDRIRDGLDVAVQGQEARPLGAAGQRTERKRKRTTAGSPPSSARFPK